MIGLEELKERIKLKYDADELVDLLHITVDELLDRFEHRIILYRDNFISEEYFEEEEEWNS